MTERVTHLRTCPLCEAMCGLEVHVEDDRVALIRADRDDVWSKGYLCPKGTTLGHLHHDPDRLRSPLIKEGGEFREATWDEAFARCGELLGGIIERHGKAAVTAYIGNPTAHNYSLGRYIGLFLRHLASGNARAGLAPHRPCREERARGRGRPRYERYEREQLGVEADRPAGGRYIAFQ